jgi:Armadillo/beta-catenin-like repeat
MRGGLSPKWYVSITTRILPCLFIDTEELKPQLLEMGICDVLIPLTNSSSIEVQGNSAAALGNLTSKGQ